MARRILAGVRHRVRPRTNPGGSAELGRGIRRLIIHTAVAILLCIRVAVRLRLIGMLERERSGYCDHPRLKSGEFSVGHVAKAS